MDKLPPSSNRPSTLSRCLVRLARVVHRLPALRKPRSSGHACCTLESPPTAAPPPPSLTPAAFTVLVVDDDSVCRQMLAVHLRALNQHVEAVESGRGALHRLRSKFFNIIILDMYMPDMDGVQTAEAIRRLSPHYSRVPIIGLTADYQRRAMKKALDGGMDAFLTKPIGPADLVHILRHWREPGPGDPPEQTGCDRGSTTFAY